MTESSERFAAAVEDYAYPGAIRIALKETDPSRRGYVMAHAAMSFTRDIDAGIQMGEAIEELLEADTTGVLQPPLPETLKANLATFKEKEINRGLPTPHLGLGAVLLAQVVEHGAQVPTVATY